VNLIELRTKTTGILHRKEFHNLNCSTIIIVRATEGNVRKADGKRPYRILALWRYNIKRVCFIVKGCNEQNPVVDSSKFGSYASRSII
jgi:hypothetical protein